MKRLSIIFLLLLVPALAFGATTWTTAVTQDGAGGACEDGGECSVAEFNALSGDYSNSVFYFSGTFTSTVDVGISGTLDNEVILDGYETDNTTYQNLSEATGRAKIDVTTSLAGIAIDGGDYIEVVDFEITDFDQAIRVALTTESNDITIKRCYMYEGSNGIYFGSASYNITIGGSSGNGNVIKNIGTTTAGEDIALGQNTHDIIISYNHLYADSSSWGIDGIMSLGSDDVLVEYNSIHEHNKTVNLGENGIDLKRNCSDWIIRYNDIYGHNEQGIEIILNGSALGSADRIYIYGNRIHDGDVYALMAQYDAAAQFDDIYIFSNLIYGFDRDGINISNKGTFTIFNNTISENAATPVNTHDLGVYIGGGAGAIVLKNNILIKNRPNESD